jgi:hypothetical protein
MVNYGRSLASQDYWEEDRIAHEAYMRIATRVKEDARHEQNVDFENSYASVLTGFDGDDVWDNFEDLIEDIVDDLVRLRKCVIIPLMAYIAIAVSTFLDPPAMIGITAIVTANLIFKK